MTRREVEFGSMLIYTVTAILVLAWAFNVPVNEKAVEGSVAVTVMRTLWRSIFCAR